MANPFHNFKNDFLLDPTVIFLNHGSFGATPKPVFEVYQKWQRELEAQPVEFLGRRASTLLEHSRIILAEYLHTRPENLVFVTNATTGLNAVIRSIHLSPAAEVLTSEHEYGALDRTWHFMAKSQGFRYINHPIPLPLTTPEEFLEDFWRGVTPHTRVIFLSHITSPTAIIFPVRQICERARQAGILTIIDGAHAPGQIPLNLDELGVDFYSGNLHKWLCAPKGSAFLYARPEVQAMVEPLIVSWGYEAEVPGISLFNDYLEWLGTRDISAFLSVSAAIEYQRLHHWEVVWQNCHNLLSAAIQRVSKMSNLPLLHPDSLTWYGQMASAPLPLQTNTALLKEQLYADYRVEVPIILWNHQPLIRISIQAYNTPDDVEILCRGLAEILELAD